MSEFFEDYISKSFLSILLEMLYLILRMVKHLTGYQKVAACRLCTHVTSLSLCSSIVGVSHCTSHQKDTSLHEFMKALNT